MTDRNKGILFMVLSSLFLALIAFFLRLSGNLPTMEKVFFHNVVCFMVSMVLVYRRGGSIWGNDKKSLLARCIFGFFGAISYIYAIDRLPLANAVILNQIYPFFVLVLSFVFLREKLLKIQGIAFAVAVTGIVLIVKPGAGYALLPSLVGLLSALFAGAAYVMVRYLRLSDDPLTIVFYYTGFTTFAAIPFMLFGQFVIPDTRQLLVLFAVGISATAAQFFMTHALRYCEAGDLSIYAYSNTVFAMFIGMTVWREFPDLFSFAGVLLVLAGAYINWRAKLNVPRECDSGSVAT